MKNTTPTARLMSRKEVAEDIGVSPATLAQWAYQGRGPKYIRVGKFAKYRWSDVESWLHQQETGGEAA
ncbi:helix-turn-helix domain-containing protein [Amycolatopsis cynarae]|uniref:Helix-turn-helix domain-containing protein n=1 Tax=Amycolatopsis cynarae TaxID=2995223 RepID=A0ABY7AZ36_9PSEU|nr:helix-turn-helix domain-containing protein [Amycolatopsis sp. HUAS 11-8]WAL64464.1 helix-turn-helix domain-containing protein [Amycolatopsis sp. HUAS 11-8]